MILWSSFTEVYKRVTTILSLAGGKSNLLQGSRFTVSKARD